MMFFPNGGFLYANFNKNKINGNTIIGYPFGKLICGNFKKNKYILSSLLFQ